MCVSPFDTATRTATRTATCAATCAISIEEEYYVSQNVRFTVWHYNTLQRALQRALQHALQRALQHALQHALQYALQHALQRTLQRTLQCTLQHTLQHTRPTHSIMYVHFLVARFQEITLLILQHKHSNLLRRIRCSKIWSSAQDHALLVLLLNMIEPFISAWPRCSGGNDLC